MSSDDGNPPLLVLTNSIYAKRKDGNFYPGLIEGKYLNTYMVKFNDGAKERVVEGDLTWLGFWGIPPWSWPTTPVIQPVMSSWKEFDGRTVFGRDESEFQGFRSSFTEQRSDDSWLERPGSNDEASHINSDTPLPCSKGKEKMISSDHSKPSVSNHSRSSVLRFNGSILSKETSLNDIMSHAFTRGTSKGASADRSPPSQRTEKDNQEKISDLKSIFVSRATGEATRTTNTNEGLQRIVAENDRTFMEINKEISNHSRKRRRYSLSGAIENTDEEEMRLSDTDVEYYTRNDLSVSPYESDSAGPISASPSHVFGPHFPFFGEPFGMTVFGTHDATIPYSFQIQRKTRKRGEKKKCRKIYGIENRHFWCTQCRWKKACTRFASNNKILTSEFIERVHF